MKIFHFPFQRFDELIRQVEVWRGHYNSLMIRYNLVLGAYLGLCERYGLNPVIRSNHFRGSGRMSRGRRLARLRVLKESEIVVPPDLLSN